MRIARFTFSFLTIVLLCLWGFYHQEVKGQTSGNQNILIDGIKTEFTSQRFASQSIPFETGTSYQYIFSSSSTKPIVFIYSQPRSSFDVTFVRVPQSGSDTTVAAVEERPGIYVARFTGDEAINSVKVIAKTPSRVSEIEARRATPSSTGLSFTMTPQPGIVRPIAQFLPPSEIKSWSNNEVSALVPGRNEAGPVLALPESEVNISLFGNEGNSLPFTQRPVVTSVSPQSGPPGTWVTIRGRGFGSRGEVRFCGDENCNEFARGLSVPSFCPAPWTDTQVIVRVPDFKTDSGNALPIKVFNSVKNVLSSPSPVAFTVQSGPLPPGICGIVEVSSTNQVFSAREGDILEFLAGNLSTEANKGANAPIGMQISLQNVSGTASIITSNGQPTGGFRVGKVRINESNVSGAASITSTSSYLTKEKYCPVLSDSGPRVIKGGDWTNLSSNTFYSGPFYPIEDSSLPGGRTEVRLSEPRSDSIVLKVVNQPVVSPAQFRAVANEPRTATVNLFQHGYDIYKEVPFDAEIVNFTSSSSKPLPPTTRTIGYRILAVPSSSPSLVSNNSSIILRVGEIPASNELTPVEVDLSNVPVGTWNIAIEQTYSYSFICSTCGANRPKEYRTNLGIASIELKISAGTTLNGLCIDADGRVFERESRKVSATLSSNSIDLAINMDPLTREGYVISSNPPTGQQNICPNMRLTLDIRTPCPFGSKEVPDETSGGLTRVISVNDPRVGSREDSLENLNKALGADLFSEWCQNFDGERIGRLSLDPTSLSNLYLIRSASACSEGELRVSATLNSALKLRSNGKATEEVNCLTRVSAKSEPIMSGEYPTLKVGERITITPSRLLEPNTTYSLLIPFGTCSTAIECASDAHQVSGLETNDIRILLQPKLSFIRFTTATQECRVRRIEVDPARPRLRDTSTPVTLKLRAFSKPSASDPNDVELSSGVTFQTISDASSQNFLTVTQENTDSPTLTPKLQTTSDAPLTGSLTVQATYGVPQVSPDATLKVNVIADACDLPWSFTDNELNFRTSYCAGKIGANPLPGIGKGPGQYNTETDGGFSIKTLEIDGIRNATKGGIVSLLREYLLPLTPPSTLPSSPVVRLSGDARVDSIPAQSCNVPGICNLTSYPGYSANSFFTLNGRVQNSPTPLWPRYRFTKNQNGSTKVAIQLATPFSDLSRSSICNGTPEGSYASRYRAKNIPAGTVFDPIKVNTQQLNNQDPSQPRFNGNAEFQVSLLRRDGSSVGLPQKVSRPLSQILKEESFLFPTEVPAGEYEIKVELLTWQDSSVTFNGANIQPRCGSDAVIPAVRYGLLIGDIEIVNIPSRNTTSPDPNINETKVTLDWMLPFAMIHRVGVWFAQMSAML